MNLSKTDRLQIKSILVMLCLTITTSLTIYFLYGYFYFKNWPWLRFSFLMSTLTCLWAYAIWFFKIAKNNKSSLDISSVMMLAIIIIPLDFILLYPGAHNIGISSDSVAGYLLTILYVQHGLAYYIIQRYIVEYLKY